jgi:hypothetical protein
MEACCCPSQVSVPIHPRLLDDDKLDIVVFDFPAMLASLFTFCPLLNKLDNLVVNPLDYFGKYNSPNSHLGKVNSGQWYDIGPTTTWSRTPTRILCALIYLQWTQWLSWRWVVLTCILFCLWLWFLTGRYVFGLVYGCLIIPISHQHIQTQNKAMAWCPLTYISCEQHYSQKSLHITLLVPGTGLLFIPRGTTLVEWVEENYGKKGIKQKFTKYGNKCALFLKWQKCTHHIIHLLPTSKASALVSSPLLNFIDHPAGSSECKILLCGWGVCCPCAP